MMLGVRRREGERERKKGGREEGGEGEGREERKKEEEEEEGWGASQCNGRSYFLLDVETAQWGGVY